MLGQLLIVFSIGILGIWKSIPVGLVMKVHPLWICLMTILGATLGILIIMLIGEKIKNYLAKWLKSSSMEKKENRLLRLFNRYGVHGMGILGTLIIGPNMTMALGLTIVYNPKVLFLWTSIGIIIWTATLTYLGYLGISIF
jgi:membrane protein DedA with SNARE-associated domain